MNFYRDSAGFPALSLPIRPDPKECTMADPHDMWRCPVSNCGYVYDPDRGDRRRKIPKGTKFEDLPDDWVCPLCGVGKEDFEKEA